MYSIVKKSGTDSVTTYAINYNACTAEGVAVELPDKKGTILLVRCRKGALFCRIFSKEISERLDTPAAFFAASSIEEMLEKNPVALTEAALRCGASNEMSGIEILEVFS